MIAVIQCGDVKTRVENVATLPNSAVTIPS
jgi:hypothetical protein